MTITLSDLAAACVECGRTGTVTEEYATDFREWLARGRAIEVEEGGASLQQVDAHDETERLIRSALSGAGWAVTGEDGEDIAPVCPGCADRIKVELAARSCPDWCATDHAAQPWGVVGEFMFCHDSQHNSDCIRLHQWGKLAPCLELNPDQIEWTIETPEEWHEAAAWLRGVATEALAMAEWLEAQR